MKNKKTNRITGIISVIVAAAMICCVVVFSQSTKLKASEDDGNVSAETQQEEQQKETKATVIEVEVKKDEPPEKEETPKEEESPKDKEEPAEAELPEESEPEPEEKSEETIQEESSEDDMIIEAQEEKQTEVEESKLTVSVKIDNNGTIHCGDTVTLKASVSGTDDYEIAWMVKKSGESEWNGISGANGDTYKYTADEENADNSYRAIVTMDSEKINSETLRPVVTVSEESKETEVDENTEAMEDGEIAETSESEPVEQKVEVTANIAEGATVESGTVLKLHANLYGFENETYTVQWQVSENGSEYKDIPGANSLDYSVELTAENEDSSWRVVVNS